MVVSIMNPEISAFVLDRYTLKLSNERLHGMKLSETFGVASASPSVSEGNT